MDFQIVLVGLNHRTADVNVRERFALTDHCSSENWALPCDGSISEALILSTCNRVELLGVGKKNLREEMLRHWAEARNAQVSDLLPYVYTHCDLEACRHLFTVAASLDSMVLGEPQILGQLKNAYRLAVENGTSGVIMNTLLHRAFSVAKRVRNETAVGTNAVSISFAAVALAKRIFGEMPEHKAMLIGAGEMAELAAMHLLQAGINELLVTNRTFAHGDALAKRFSGRFIPFESFIPAMLETDIIITSTGSPEPIIKARDLKPLLTSRKNRPMFFIDIAVPRDIDPDVNNLDNIYLYDIDDLKEVVEENLAGRRDEALKASSIIDNEVQTFALWLKNLEAKPTIKELVRRGEETAREEVYRTLKKLGPIPEEKRMAIEIMAQAIARKLNHQPIMFLKQKGMSKDGPTNRISLVRRIFDLDHTDSRNRRH